MTRNEGNFIGAAIGIGFIAIMGTAWVVNLFKLIGVAMAQEWGSTVVHALGLLGPIAIITVWF